MKLTSQDSYCALQSRSNVITKQHIRKEKTFENFKNLNLSLVIDFSIFNYKNNIQTNKADI